MKFTNAVVKQTADQAFYDTNIADLTNAAQGFAQTFQPEHVANDRTSAPRHTI